MGPGALLVFLLCMTCSGPEELDDSLSNAVMTGWLEGGGLSHPLEGDDDRAVGRDVHAVLISFGGGRARRQAPVNSAAGGENEEASKQGREGGHEATGRMGGGAHDTKYWK